MIESGSWAFVVYICYVLTMGAVVRSVALLVGSLWPSSVAMIPEHPSSGVPEASKDRLQAVQLRQREEN